MDIIQTIRQSATSIKKKVIDHRRHLHKHPELSFYEKETAKYIADTLQSLSIPFKDGVGGYGIIAHIGTGSKTVALRGDMDALPIQELNDASYASCHPGVMHACGHDVHTSCLLGAAEILKRIENRLKGTVRLIFQPAEEKLPGGASLMIADGALKNPDVELIFGQHVFPDMEVGHVGFREGMYMASTDELHITIVGKGGHAALPHSCIDPILIASHIIVGLQHLVSRRANVNQPTVLSIGKIRGDGATNVIPDKVFLEGTLRTMDENWRLELHQLIKRFIQQMCDSMGGQAEIEIRMGYPCLTNNPALTSFARKVAIDALGEKFVHELPLRMTAEDFAYYAQEIPACFYRLGTSNAAKGLGAPLHTGHFDIDEDALEIGTALMASLAYRALEEN